MFSEEMSNALQKKCQILGQILAALVRILSFPRMNMNSYVDYCELSYEQRENNPNIPSFSPFPWYRQWFSSSSNRFLILNTDFL